MRGMGSNSVVPNWLLGLALVAVVAVGSVLAYTKELPFGDRFEVHAVFPSAQTLRPSAPVRIAGVTVGEVTAVEGIGSAVPEPGAEPRPAVRVTMEIDEHALPLRRDATFKVRPRLFIDGNYFVDVQPGSPSAEEVGDGHTFGPAQTAHSVQLDQVLGVLQTDTRTHLRTLLDQLGNALVSHGGSRGVREIFRVSGPSYRYSALVAESQLGTHQGDLRGMVRGLGRVLGGLSRNEEALRDLVTNLRVVTGAFAAEDRALGRAIERLPAFLAAGEPAFREVNSALPSLRAFAREALPGVRRSPAALRAGLPLLRELRALVSRRELRGLVARLRPTIPSLATLAKANTELFRRQRAFSSCFNEVIIPWSHSTPVPVESFGYDYPLEVGGRTFELTGYGLAHTSSESRSGDGGGQHLRVLAGSGANIVRYPEIAPDAFGLTPFPIEGALPRLTDSAKTEYRPGVACETQEPPNLEAGVGAPPADQQPVSAAGRPDLDLQRGAGARRLRADMELIGELDELLAAAPSARERERLIERGQRFVDALGLTEVDVRAAVRGAE